jgi:hypothetical protein
MGGIGSLAPKPGGHPRTVELREVINGILYVLRGGIPWRMLPHDFPPWGTVWWYFRQWRQDQDPYFDGHYFGALSYQQKPPGGEWSEAQVLVVPPVPPPTRWAQRRPC